MNGFLLRLQQDDQSVIDDIASLYYVPFRWVAASFGIKEQSVFDELFSDVITEIWQQRKTFNAEEHIKAACITLMRNKSIDHWRTHKNKQTQPLHQAYEAAVEPYNKLDIEEAERVAELIRRAVDNLPPQCREIIRLHFGEEAMSVKEITAKLNLQQSNVSGQKIRAIKILKRSLKGLATSGDLAVLFRNLSRVSIFKK